ncbi:regulatory helix-turn-helix protein, lysR family [Aliiroseovarius halocynthiae]|uniref:LysR family transcriptional regulator n=2 Tax=Aliiroseovarius halocynthiae TaxID=985055 RepID=A0A545SR22_9RHOB|nr:LysR family transcriptional regulator [Aliiroseovarius halocynthiae]TQV67409.1 LysR family transcriptional regulator [Aliiroseovarius halocynthiae]SMR81387.1 regulatory helix-turn-helix protein, lysR family [Aliiroseovarius halocynthiae]
MSHLDAPALLYEMLRSFASLARTLNLSQTVKEIGSTRQTVRRHIALLEEYMGNPLFSFENRHYELTETGENSLKEAEELLARGAAWLNNESRHVQGLHYLALQEGKIPYFLQQHPLTTLWDTSSELLKFGFHSWAQSQGELESPDFASLRPYLMVFRYNAQNGDWICTEVGEKSSFATWFGWEKYRSAVGRSAVNLPTDKGYSYLLTQSFNDVANTRSVRLDHIHTHMPHGADAKPTPISYHRLVMACRYADGDLALATLIDRTLNVQILDLPDEMRLSMPEGLAMDIQAPF